MEQDNIDSRKLPESGNLAFFRDVASYFMDFLETDFHKRKNPRRSIKLRNQNNLLTSLKIDKYPRFEKELFKKRSRSFQEKETLSIQKNVYKSDVPVKVLELINLQVEKITKQQVTTVTKMIAVEIERAVTLFAEDREQAQVYSIERISELFRNTIVKPFIEHIDQPIRNAELGDENTIYLAEEELVSVLVNGIESRVSELINLLIVGDSPNITKNLSETLSHEFVTQAILSFFAQYQVGDLYTELFELDRNRGILDKEDFYYYFYDISYRKVKYPIFYIPLYISRDKDIFNIEFDSQIYINKKALEFIVQEHNVETNLVGTLQSIKERIIYLADGEESVTAQINGIIAEIEGVFDLTTVASLEVQTPLVSKSQYVQVSNSGYIALFEKSDEALVNDYEDILQKLSEENSSLGSVFSALIEDFINKEPVRIVSDIEDEWRETSIAEKLVFKSPIPLNSEQRQIVSALKKDNCKYVTVEGPPGTGKSHTITSILFDAVLANQSVLVLSDKKEALDVVEDKIVSTLRSVRNSDDFQNPILRLGKAGSNYAKILSPQSILSIKNYHNALKSSIGDIEIALDNESESLVDDLNTEIGAYEEININEIVETEVLYSELKQEAPYLVLDELLLQDDSKYDLDDLYQAINWLKWFYENEELSAVRILLGINDSIKDISLLREPLFLLGDVLKVIKDKSTKYSAFTSFGKMFSSISGDEYLYLTSYLQEIGSLRSPLIGLLFKGGKIQQLDNDLAVNIPGLSIDKPSLVLAELTQFKDFLDEILSSINDNLDIDLVELIHFIITTEKIEDVQDVALLLDKIESVWNFSSYPILAKELSITDSYEDISKSKLFDLSEVSLKKALSYIELTQSLQKKFNEIKHAQYYDRKNEIERNTALQMTNILDGRLIDFAENNPAIARVMREIITKKSRFPKKEFEKLKTAFPCILAGIRDYAEYIPLESNIFDLVIIDEASQVSVAQAFPALLRAKKVLIFGDRKQFSNVKASQARSDTNREYLNALANSFRTNISVESDKLVKLEKFNIKTSILEFFEFINNYNIQLTKHFRGYKELISYSNKYFYNNSLQVMKIRSKPISEVIEFTTLEYTETKEALQNTNGIEIDFIISKLLEMYDMQSVTSVGIITPHTNQQRLLAERINSLQQSEYFYKQLQLKIMTFDTCQGEERDIIFYSMVANPVSDRLWGVFIKNLSDIDIEEDNKIKAQRLNVGFSRAKEKMHFVVSKPLADFEGTVRDALMHYQYQIEQSRLEYSSESTDQRSAMEPQLLNWFYQTEFWNKADKDNVQFIPQFKLGTYLKQLDEKYVHPAYVVDFLLVYKDERFKQHKIIIEYDGFYEHFQNLDEVTELNFENYYTEEDVFRQKVLEGYGYQFLRINKFNVGINPVTELNNRINTIINGVTEHNVLVSRIQKTADGLDSGNMKKCPRCGLIKESTEFYDSTLISGKGKICLQCKNGHRRIRTIEEPQVKIDPNIKCPRCGSGMVSRKGKFGHFYGCSKYPHCRGTRQKS